MTIMALRSIYLLVLMIIGLFFSNEGRAQFLDPVSFSIENAPQRVQAGEPFTVDISATIEGKWHLYSILNAPDAGPFPTQFFLESDFFFPADYARESKAVIEYDPNFETDLGWHSKEAQFRLRMAFDPDQEVTQNPQEVRIRVRYQACDDVSCLPPKSKEITFSTLVSGRSESAVTRESTTQFLGEEYGEFRVDPVEMTEALAQKQSGSTIGQTTDDLTSDGLFSFMWIAITAGFAALLTPCVFPMIPLTVSFFSKQSEQKKGNAVQQAVLFGISVVIMFTVIGALLALIIGVSGANQFASNPWVNLMIGMVLVVFGISLLGFFEIRLPYQLTNWLNRQSNESSGVLGILFMALTISAVSFSCTAPFVGAVLAATAGGEWFYPILGMIGFSAAFASPFVLLAIFPDWLQSLPKSGSWMNLVKVTLGFIELAAAFKFISNADLVWQWGLISRPFTIAAWMALFLLASFYLLGMFSLSGEKRPESITPGRVVAAFPFLLFVVYLIPGLMGASLGIWDAWLPPKQATDISVVMSVRSGLQTSSGSGLVNEEDWSEDYEQSLASASEENIPMFVDFTGYTCTNCRAMETNVFPLQEVQERFSQYELVRLYTDDGITGPEHQRLQFELTGTVALPTYAIVDPQTGNLLELLVGYVQPEKFTAFLDRGLQSYETVRP
jgi:thiol:disulfide interchange protein DsbD